MWLQSYSLPTTTYANSTQPPWPISQAPSFLKKSSQLACPEYSPPGLSSLALPVMHCLHKSYKNLYRRKVARLRLVLREILSSLGQTCGILTVVFQCTWVFGRKKKNQWLFLEVGILGRECSHSPCFGILLTPSHIQSPMLKTEDMLCGIFLSLL